MEKRAQGAIEYLLILAAMVLVVSVLITANIGVIGIGKAQTESGKNYYNTQLNNLYNGGTTKIDGLCGAANNSCTTGTFSDKPDSPTNYLWDCLGSNGGSNAACSLPITLIGTPPSAPSSLSASTISSSQINLTWSASSGATSYNIYRSTSPGFETALVAGVITNSYSNTGLQPNTTYYYKVSAVNVNGESNLSAEASSTTNAPAIFVNTPLTGIYLLDVGPQGGCQDPNRLCVMDDADVNFVDGFAWRMSWDSFDSDTGPSYNFSGIDALITKLQSLSTNTNNRLKFSFSFSIQDVPQYVVNGSSQTFTTNLPGGNGSVTAPVPWDPYAITQYRNFINALANHPVYDAVSHTYIPLKDHPSLAQLNAGVIGMQSLRTQSVGNLFSQSSYDRNKFIEGVVSDLRVVSDAFPNKRIYVGFFNLGNDGTNNPSIDSAMISRLSSEFDGVNRQHLGFFQENLRGDSPNTSGNLGLNLLSAKQQGGYVLFQACGAWTNHAPCTFTAGDNSPANGFNLGYNTYGAVYYEIYDQDIKNSSFKNAFNQWHTTLWQN